MKTWEMYKYSLENPDSMFIRKDGTNCGFTHEGCLFDINGNYPRNILANEEWELVRQPVDFMTAVNSEKLFKPESWIYGTNDEFRSLYDNLEMFSGRQCVQVKILNGKWLIE